MAVFSLDMRYCDVAIALLALNGPDARHDAHRDLDGQTARGSATFLGLLDAREIVSGQVQPYGRSVSNFASMSATNAFEVISHYAVGHAMREKNAFVAISDRAYVVS
jgi:hypothetical protein